MLLLATLKTHTPRTTLHLPFAKAWNSNNISRSSQALSSPKASRNLLLPQGRVRLLICCCVLLRGIICWCDIGRIWLWLLLLLVVWVPLARCCRSRCAARVAIVPCTESGDSAALITLVHETIMQRNWHEAASPESLVPPAYGQ